MKPIAALAAAIVILLVLLRAADPAAAREEVLTRHRNLGKAFYENPATPRDAVEEFRKALALAPESAREQLNYGLALLRVGRTAEGVALLEKVQKSSPKLPHTWFNLGIVYKKQGEQEKAIAQFERLVQLAPDEAIAHYNLGALYRLAGRNADAIREFETAARLDALLAAPHFQLFNLYRGVQPDLAKRELAIFQQLKKQQEGAAIPEDVDWSQYAEVLDIMADSPPDQAPAQPAFSARKLIPSAAGILLLDANADGRADLLTWTASEVRLRPVQLIAKGAVSVAAGDFNNDGLQDLCVAGPDAPALYVNQKGKFQKHGAALPARAFTKVVWLDYDHDYDLDLFLLGPRPALLRNQGTAGFEDRTGDFPFASGQPADAVTFRVVPDTKGWDLAVTYADREGVLYRDMLGGKYKAETIPLKRGARQLQAADVDNDGWVDLLSSAGGRVELWRHGKPVKEIAQADSFALADIDNRGLLDLIVPGGVHRNAGKGEFGKFVKIASIPACAGMTAHDIDLDGRVDLACGAAVLTNTTVAKNRWIRVKLAGVKNLKLAEGAEVEVKAGARYQKKPYRGLPLVFGLGGHASVDTVRITWANGLVQNEVRQPAGRSFTYREAQRLSGSCPMIWTWNGREFEYITDVLGVAPLGASAGDGKYFPVDHDEYIQISGKSLAPANGQYEVRITEELSEVAYLDQVRLFSVDHPAGIDIFTNDKFKGPPFPGFRLFGVGRRVYPKAVRGDVRERILARDRSYAGAFRRDMSGVAEMHAIELDFGQPAARDNRAVLILSGWVDWADGSTFLGAAQEKRGGLVPPYLQVKDAAGRWRTVIEDMGMPAGKPKTIAVDLGGKFLSDSREVRIITNLALYWDEIFLAESGAPPTVKLTLLGRPAADLRFRGFSPVRLDPERGQPESFVYPQPRPLSMWNPTPGLYTRYGEVASLVHDVDDRFVIMGSGDELRLRFPAAGLPELPQGWRRDFLLKVDGWAKDRDANTAYSQSVEPLPFHGMSQYPYPSTERYPDTLEHRRYRAEYNTRPALRPLTSLRAHNR